MKLATGSQVYIAPLYVWAIFAVIITYLGAVLYLLSYLQRVHKDEWLRLGSPSFYNLRIINSIRLMLFLVHFRHRTLNDPFLSRLIWLIRVLFTLAMAMFTVGDVFGLTPSP